MSQDKELQSEFFDPQNVPDFSVMSDDERTVYFEKLAKWKAAQSDMDQTQRQKALETFDEAAEIARQNGLTDEILNDILENIKTEDGAVDE